MRISKTLTHFIAAATLGLGLFGCSSPIKRPTIEVTDVRLASMDREAIQFTVALRVSNPNPVDISLSELQAELSIAGQKVGQAESLQAKTNLTANAAVTLPMRVVVPVKTLPDAIRQGVLALGSGSLPYKITGSATVLNGVLPVSFEKTGDLARRR